MDVRHAIILELRNGARTRWELSKRLDVPLSTIARHLRTLRRQGLIKGKMEVAGGRARRMIRLVREVRLEPARPLECKILRRGKRVSFADSLKSGPTRGIDDLARAKRLSLVDYSLQLVHESWK